MMTHKFGDIPQTCLSKPEPFIFRIPEDEVADFKTLLTVSKIGPATWENQQEDENLGVSRKWLEAAKEAWLQFEWHNIEDHINAFPNYKITIDDSHCGTLSVHFSALFSSKSDALPVIFMHGWPGLFLEFLPMLEILTNKYTPESLPYHIIVPSLPGYGFSSSPMHMGLTMTDSARIMNQLMIQLGFGNGYVAQGGDIGSMLARIMSGSFDECKAFHGDDIGSLDDLNVEEAAKQRDIEQWRATGTAYSVQQGTKPSTIGLALSASPLALLAWVGEKFRDWANPQQPLPLDTILGFAGIYWFTSSFPRSIYPYREIMLGGGLPDSKVKPFGYSAFASDILVVPKSWVEKLYPNMIQYKYHTKGGHFAALEEPEVFLQDIEEFLKRADVVK